MEITVNGRKMEWKGGTVLGLLESLKIRPQSVVVEKNLQILSREELEREPLNAGDSIEIIRLVGGG